jgi:hypothetical protein
MKDVPLGVSNKKVKGGTGLQYGTYNGSGCIFVLKGYKNEFYRYHPDGDSWHTLSPAPVGGKDKWDKGSWIVHNGVSTIYAHKAKYHEFYAYNTDVDVWYDTLTGMPIAGANGNKKAKDGSCAAFYDNAILALKGGNTQELWHYFVDGDTWHQLETIPSYGSAAKKKKVKSGAGLVSAGAKLFYVTKGNRSREFWRYRLAGEVAVREDYSPVTLADANTVLSIAPNPATGAAVLRLPQALRATSIRICDVTGRLVLQSSVGVQTSSLRLDLRTMPPGVYLVQVRGPGHVATCRLVKE